jgi:transposase InsO family protein
VEDRQSCIEMVREARASGARRQASCAVLEVSLRTVERWEKQPDKGDQRRGPGSECGHALSEEEKQAIVKVSSCAEYRDLSPWQIVARLADTGQYLGSESSFYRVLKQNDLLSHRHNSKPRVHHRPKDLTARNPNQVWSWDITYLNSPMRGGYYYLYLVEDIFSRMIVGWSIEEVESAEHGARLVDRICQEQGIARGQLTLHSDNGGPMTGATMVATLERLGVIPSLSRPAVSDDNPYSESLFKTLKYRPSYPDGAFDGIDQAREWVHRFVKWYNAEHLHSAIRFVTPGSRHHGLDKAILTKRTAVYENAKRLNPLRWSGQTRNWSPITEVHLNPKKETIKTNVEIPIYPGSDHSDSKRWPKDVVVSGHIEQNSNASGVSPKNGLHSCPTTNDRQSGKGLGRGKNRLSKHRLQSSCPSSIARFKQTGNYPVSTNLT